LENFEKQIKLHSGEKKRQLILIINGVCLREESCVSGESENEATLAATAARAS
jgi:hypothetical protein